jgi:serine/threonine protein kinase
MSPEPFNPETPTSAKLDLEALRATAGRIKPGAVLDGRYDIVSKLGQGGICEVYRGRHKQLNRDAAIKVLLPQFVQDEDVRERFSREAKALAHLKHAGIVEIYCVGDPPGTPFIAI